MIYVRFALSRVMNATLVIRNYNVETLVLAEELRVYATYHKACRTYIVLYISSDNVCDFVWREGDEINGST